MRMFSFSVGHSSLEQSYKLTRFATLVYFMHATTDRSGFEALLIRVVL